MTDLLNKMGGKNTTLLEQFQNHRNTEATDTPNIHIYDHSHSWSGTAKSYRKYKWLATGFDHLH